MISSAIASRYAGALVDVVTAPATHLEPAEAVGQLRAFSGALESSTELRHVLASPAVSPARKRTVVRRLADRLELAAIVRNFLLVLVDHRRSAALAEIIDSFELLLDERLGFARAEVQSARDMDERQRTDLAARLSQLTGRQVRMRFSVEPGLIGGVVARIGSTVYDGSVRGQLNALGRSLGAE